MYDTFVVVAVDDVIIRCIQLLQPRKHIVITMLLITGIYSPTHLVTDSRQQVDTFTYGIDIHHGAATHDSIRRPRKQAWEQRHYITLKLSRTIIFVQPQYAYKW